MSPHDACRVMQCTCTDNLARQSLLARKPNPEGFLLAAPSPPAPPFVGTTQVFVVMTNESAASAGRKLLQAQDVINFGILLVPIPLGTAFYTFPPTNRSALNFYGTAPGGNVSIYANGNLLAIIPCSGGTGSLALSLPRTNLFFTSSYQSNSNAFPSTPTTGPGSAIVVTPNGVLQAASAPAPPNPPPGKVSASQTCVRTCS